MTHERREGCRTLDGVMQTPGVTLLLIGCVHVTPLRGLFQLARINAVPSFRLAMHFAVGRESHRLFEAALTLER